MDTGDDTVNTNVLNRNGTFLLLLALLCSLVIGSPATAQVVFQETFEDGSIAGGAVFGGAFVPGMSGQGWSSTLVSEGLKEDGKVFLEYRLSPDFFKEDGTLEFYLQRKATPISDDIQEESIIEISDSAYKSIMTVKILWDNPKLLGVEGSGLQVYGNYLIEELASEPWGGEYFPFGRSINPGEWIHVALTWGTRAGDNWVFLNGEPLTNFRNEYGKHHDPQNLQIGDILSHAVHVRIGAESFSRDPEITWSPLSNSVVDELRIHDIAFNPLVPVINSVSHDAFEVAGFSGKLVSGDTVTLKVVAEPGGEATFNIGDRITRIPMIEDATRAGTYIGFYEVPSGYYLEDGLITATFVNDKGVQAKPVTASRTLDIDARTHLEVKSSNDLVPADEKARSGITVVANDANGKAVKEHELRLTLSTTDEYTGTVGGGTFDDLFGGTVDVDWDGVTDSFGEVTAQYVSGFAAKTILVSAKDMASGDVGVGWVRSYIDGTVDIVVTEPQAKALSVAGSMDVSYPVPG